MGFLSALDKILGGYNGYASRLTGKKLEYSVVMCAGVAFLLFGYGERRVSMAFFISDSHLVQQIRV